MNTSLFVHIINFVSLVLSVCQLCIASSIFDFVVVNKLYYTTDDEKPLIDSQYAIVFFSAPLLAASIALFTLSMPIISRGYQNWISRHLVLVAIMHALLLAGAAVFFATCSLLSSQLSLRIGHYAYNGTPQNFEDASHWYFLRMRASTAIFCLQSLCALSQLGLLYMGRECRYEIILPQQKDKKDLLLPPVHD
ncbi:hypothetical protein PMAYCL1PPCAC_11188 [Pristionchus mayeri]|uniref:Tetraspannin n=1 Tax=Pristionchus mayeri TaxID=1317129 RepID=A0AAN4ZM50_9BILA|nr:hypothetical protein PMAYCL1PPCAC_11188 [Pristionchus mayeri]